MTALLNASARPLMRHIPHEAKEPRPTMSMAEYARAENRAMNLRAKAATEVRQFSAESQATVLAVVVENPGCTTPEIVSKSDLGKTTVQGCLVALWRAKRIIRSRQFGVNGFIYTAAAGEATGDRIACGCSTHDYCGRHGCLKGRARRVDPGSLSDCADRCNDASERDPLAKEQRVLAALRGGDLHPIRQIAENAGISRTHATNILRLLIGEGTVGSHRENANGPILYWLKDVKA